jgi:sn-glycerol 3-phosphate transport system ATP-binding protein
MMFQNYALYPHMTVEQNIGYPLKIAGVDKAERAKRVRAAAEMLGLGDYLARRPAQLSGGQRQRVAMGRAIVREPKVFLFDEPLSNLDAQLRVQMRIELRRLHKRLGATSILVTHDQVEAMTLADRLVVMNGGHVEQAGRPAEIYENPASEFVASFLGAPPMNLCDAEITGETTARLENARNFELAVPRTGLPAGTKVRLGFRPEAVSLDPREGMSATVDLVEELGSMRVAYCRIGSDEFAVAVSGKSSVRENIAVGLKVANEDIFLFDRQSGKRIGSAPMKDATPGLEDLSPLRKLPEPA